MKKENTLTAINLLTLVICLSTIAIRLPPSEQKSPDLVPIVYAIRDIPQGNTINASDLAETSVPRSTLPAGYKGSEANMDFVRPYTIIDVAGRISLGIYQSDLVVFKYPGFKGKPLSQFTRTGAGST